MHLRQIAFSLFENFTTLTPGSFQRKMILTFVLRESLRIMSLFGKVLDATTEGFKRWLLT